MSSDQTRNRDLSQSLVHRILLVEDDAETAKSLKESLEKKGFEVRTAKDAGQAYAGFKMHRPELVLLDLILPGESGFEVCDRMKRDDETIPVIVISAIELEDAKDLAIRVGADGYLTKPVDIDELLTCISECAQAVWEEHHTDRPVEKDRLRFTCPCGKRFRVSSVHRGRTMTCPDCGSPITVPRHN